MSRRMKYEQRGGKRTPYPLDFYTPGPPCDFYRKQVIYNECGHPMSQPDQPIVGSCCGAKPTQQGGSPTPLPMAWFDPQAETRPGYKYECVHDAAKCGYYAKSDYRRGCPHLTSQCSGQFGGGNVKNQSGGSHVTCQPPCSQQECGKDSYPLPGKYLDLNRHLSTLGDNANPITLDNRRRMYYTYKKVYGLKGDRIQVKAVFCNPETWSEFRNADYVVGQLLEIMHNKLTGKPMPVAVAAEQCGGGEQIGGNATGAPFFIPNFGKNPNLASGQMDAESQTTTGYSYQFKTKPCCTTFGSLWGSNLPTYNPI